MSGQKVIVLPCFPTFSLKLHPTPLLQLRGAAAGSSIVGVIAGLVLLHWLSFTRNVQENAWEFGVLRAIGLKVSGCHRAGAAVHVVRLRTKASQCTW